MNPVEKGDLGEIAVIKELMNQNFAVFPQMGNSSRVDLICMGADERLWKVQVKCTSSNNGVARLTLRKNTLNPKYNYHYKPSDVDVYALYIQDTDVVVFVSSSLIFKDSDRRTNFSIRISPPKNKQEAKLNWYTDFLKFPSMDAFL